MGAGGVPVGLGAKAPQTPVGGKPGVPIAVAVELPIPPGIQGLVPQGGRALPGGLPQRGQVARVVQQRQREAPLLPAQHRQGGVLGDGEGGFILQIHAGDTGEEAADGDPVAHHGHPSALVPLGDSLQRGVGPLRHLGVGLRPVQPPAGRVVQKKLRRFRLLVKDVAEKLRLPGAHVDLPQGGIGAQRKAPGLVDGACGEHGAIEIAGIHRVKGHLPQPLFQKSDLPPTQFCHAAVPVPLQDAEAIPLRLGVADEINFCHNLSLSLTKEVEYSIIKHQ